MIPHNIKSAMLSSWSNLDTAETLSLVSDKLKWSPPSELEETEKMAEIEALTGSYALKDLLDSFVASRDHHCKLAFVAQRSMKMRFATKPKTRPNEQATELSGD